MNIEHLRRFLLEKFSDLPEDGFIEWLLTFLLKSKAEQKAEYDAWILVKKARVQNAIANLEAQKLANEQALNAELAHLNAA